jgi:hypothetical protein
MLGNLRPMDDVVVAIVMPSSRTERTTCQEKDMCAIGDGVRGEGRTPSLVEPPRSFLNIPELADPTMMQCCIHMNFATDNGRPKLGRQPQGGGKEGNRACPQHLRRTSGESDTFFRDHLCRIRQNDRRR